MIDVRQTEMLPLYFGRSKSLDASASLVETTTHMSTARRERKKNPERREKRKTNEKADFLKKLTKQVILSSSKTIIEH